MEEAEGEEPERASLSTLCWSAVKGGKLVVYPRGSRELREGERLLIGLEMVKRVFFLGNINEGHIEGLGELIQMCPSLVACCGRIDCGAAPGAFKGLAPALISRPSLDTIHLKNSVFASEDLADLGDLMSSLPSLTSLNLIESDLTPDKFKTLAESLSTITQVTSLDLQRNPISLEGALWLVFLTPLSHVVTLILVNVRLGSEGVVKVLSAAAEACPLLEQLDLSNNSEVLEAPPGSRPVPVALPAT